MYDLEGSDGGREWVEVFNGGGSAVDLADWRFFEGETNHKLTAVQGGTVLAPSGYAIIADNATQFLSDTPGFSGVLFDSSFSLSNTGEPLALRDGTLADVDSVAYMSEWGATGDGNSLQKNGGSWIAARPTPGATNATARAAPPPPAGGGGGGGGFSGGSTGAGGSGSSESGTPPPSGGGAGSGSSLSAPAPATKPQISARIVGPSSVTVGALAEFRGEAIGLKGEPIENARLVWNFGDGSSEEGRAVLHSWRHPGDYVVVLSAASGEYTATSRLGVRARAAELAIGAVAEGALGFIEVRNGAGQDIDLSFWRLVSGEQHFTFPKNTILAAGAALRFGAETTGLVVVRGEAVSVLYPNGSVAVWYEWPALRSADAGTPSVAVASVPRSPAVQAPTTGPQAGSRPATERVARGSLARQAAPDARDVGPESVTDNANAVSGSEIAGIGAITTPPPAAGCESVAGSAFFTGKLGVYLAALGGLTALGAFAFLASRRSSLGTVSLDEAEAYEIVEE